MLWAARRAPDRKRAAARARCYYSWVRALGWMRWGK